MSNGKSLDDLLSELREERLALEARLAREEKHVEDAGTAAALTQTYATDLQLVALDREEARLREEQRRTGGSAKARAAFDSMLDDLFGSPAEDNPDTPTQKEND